MFVRVPPKGEPRRGFLVTARQMHDKNCAVCKITDANCTIDALLKEIDRLDAELAEVLELAKDVHLQAGRLLAQTQETSDGT